MGNSSSTFCCCAKPESHPISKETNVSPVSTDVELPIVDVPKEVEKEESRRVVKKPVTAAKAAPKRRPSNQNSSNRVGDKPNTVKFAATTNGAAPRIPPKTAPNRISDKTTVRKNSSQKNVAAVAPVVLAVEAAGPITEATATVHENLKKNKEDRVVAARKEETVPVPAVKEGLSDDLKMFVGRWEEVKARGEDMDPILGKMKVAWIKRKGYKAVSLVNELVIDSEGKGVTVINSVLGIEKRYTLPLDYTEVELEDHEVGKWHVFTRFENGEIVSTRYSDDKKIEMTTTRKILPDGDTHVLQHRTELKIKGDKDTPMQCNRIFKRLK
eukprot:Platyproteum_vivax@DN10311_c0_g1_i1.p1